MRVSGLLLAALLAACATPRPPESARPKGSTIRELPAKPRWQAVPAKADGAAVPGGRRHIVKRGETGIAIAQAYGVGWGRIAAANGLARDSVLQVGQALFVPTATATAQPPARPSTSRPPRSGSQARPPAQAAASGAFALDVDDVITGSAPAREGPRPAPRTPAPAPAQVTAAVPPLGWPVDGRVILSRFGPKAGGRVNDGINIKTLNGAPVRAAADGEVIYVGDAIAGFGLMMLVRHPGGIVTAYAHLEDALADRGDRVQRGQPIARAGSSGSADGPQLHFQLRQGRRTLDPLLYLPR
jgi:murein DD-endopeptidase MepM/ murein hydrolase activator NlpD